MGNLSGFFKGQEKETAEELKGLMEVHKFLSKAHTSCKEGKRVNKKHLKNAKDYLGYSMLRYERFRELGRKVVAQIRIDDLLDNKAVPASPRVFIEGADAFLELTAVEIPDARLRVPAVGIAHFIKELAQKGSFENIEKTFAVDLDNLIRSFLGGEDVMQLYEQLTGNRVTKLGPGNVYNIYKYVGSSRINAAWLRGLFEGLVNILEIFMKGGLSIEAAMARLLYVHQLYVVYYSNTISQSRQELSIKKIMEKKRLSYEDAVIKYRPIHRVLLLTGFNIPPYGTRVFKEISDDERKVAGWLNEIEKGKGGIEDFKKQIEDAIKQLSKGEDICRMIKELLSELDKIIEYVKIALKMEEHMRSQAGRR